MSDWKKVGKVSVDAGILWLGDPCYIMHPWNGIPKDVGKSWDEFVEILSEKEKKSKAKDVETGLQFNHDGGYEGLGVVVSTGYGDGIYDVFVKNDDDGRIAEVKIVFINNDEDDDEDDEDDDEDV